jgi:hypothetical protein
MGLAGAVLMSLLWLAAAHAAEAQRSVSEGGAGERSSSAAPLPAPRDSVRLPSRGAAADADVESADTTDYESTHSTVYEQAALIGANAVLIPLALSVAAVSIAPPSLGMVIDNGVSYATVGFETGIGLGPATESGRFAEKRLMLNYTHVYNVHRHDLWRIEGVKDFNFGFIDSRKIFAFGVSPMAGLYTDGPARGYSLGASVRLMLPSLPYFGMFPLHTIGVTYRYNRNFNGADFHTAGFGVSAAVIF